LKQRWPTKLSNFWDIVESAVGQGIVLGHANIE
jgi:hypothetical protein